METQRKQTQVNSSADSFLGMALAQTFMGAIFGPTAYAAFEAADIASEVYEDRYPSFKLGQKNSLSGAFTKQTQDWKDIILPAPSMRPAAAPSFAF